MLDHLVFDLDFETYKRIVFEDPKLDFRTDEENKRGPVEFLCF